MVAVPDIYNTLKYSKKENYTVPCDVTFSATCSPMTSISYRRFDARSTNTSNGLVSTTADNNAHLTAIFQDNLG